MIACVLLLLYFSIQIDESFLCTLDKRAFVRTRAIINGANPCHKSGNHFCGTCSIEAFIDSLRNALDYVSVALVVTNKSRQDTAACASLSFVYNVKQQGVFRPRQATDNLLPGFPFHREAGF